MGRTLLKIPRMFTAQDLSAIDPRLPDDLDDKSTEFWGYVGERFSTIGGRLKRIYLESSGVMGKRHMEMLKMNDPRQHEVVQKAIDSGAELVEAENPELVLETLSWVGKMQELLASSPGEESASTLRTIGEFLRESMRERDEFVVNSIESSLAEGEVGALIMDGSREIKFSSDIRVVTTCPFEPRDYLNSWLASLRAKDSVESHEPDVTSTDGDAE